MLGIIVCAVGFLTVALALVLRKKIGKEKWISLLISGILILLVGGMVVKGNLEQRNEDKKNSYVALMYMNSGRLEEAEFYLSNVESDIFEAACVDIMLEYCRGDKELAELKYSQLRNKTTREKELAVLKNIKEVSEEDDQILNEKIVYLMESMKISEKVKNEAENIYAVMNGYMVENGEQVEAKEILRNSVNQYLLQEQYGSAVMKAAELVEMAPTKENRLLLAEAIAEASYGNVELTGSMFKNEDENDKEKIRLESKILKNQEKLDAIEEKLQGNISEEEQKKLEEEKEKRLAKLEDVQKKYEYLYVYRAFNSIADIHSLDADIVRSRLYFSMREQQTAIENLIETSRSFGAKLETRTGVKNALNVLNVTYNDEESIGGQSEEFEVAMETLLSAGNADSVAVRTSKLTKDFANYIKNGQKNYGKKLYITGFDSSKFPEITIVLNGKKEIVDEIKSKKETIVLKDTRKEILNYEILEMEEAKSASHVCCIVDQSGSMGGQPIYDLKEALVNFIEALSGNIELGLVGFSDGYKVLFPMGDTFSVAKNIASEIGIEGGTNITAGIQGGLESCKDVKEGNKIFLLMTDGQSAVDMGVVQEAKAQGCIIHTIGFGSVNDQLLQEIADMTGGQYIKAESSEELTSIYLSLAGTIGNSVQVKYTAVDTQTEAERYIFLHSQPQKTSIRYEYTLEEKEDENVVEPLKIEEIAELGERMPYRYYQLGNLKIESGSSFLLEDKTLVLGGSYIRFSEEKETLDMGLNGYVFLKVDDAMYSKLSSNELEHGETIMLGSEGVLEGNGSMEVRYNDSAYDQRGFSYVLEGAFEIECDAVQAKVVQK